MNISISALLNPGSQAFLLCLAIFSSSSLLAQDLKPPRAPELKVPRLAEWKISYRYGKTKGKTEDSGQEEKASDQAKDKPGKKPAKLQEASYSVANGIGHLRSIYDDSSVEEAYAVTIPKLHVDVTLVKSRDPDQPIHVIKPSLPEEEYLKFLKQFPGVAWARPKRFVNVAEVMDQECLYYSDNPNEPPSDLNTDEIPSFKTREAWFSVKTGLPVAFRLDDQFGIFEFGRPTQNSITLPPEFKATMDKYLVPILRFANPSDLKL